MNTLNVQSRRSHLSAPVKTAAYWAEEQFGHSHEKALPSFVALQALFSRDGGVFGYEVLHRSGRENRFTGDADHATQSIMKNWSFPELHKLADGRPIFLNCPRQVLVAGLLERLATPVVIEVLETVEPDEEVIAACRHLKSLGYQIALDDFQLNCRIGALVDLADYIKVDFRLSDSQARRQILDYLGGRPVRLIAEKIETVDEYEVALHEGFEIVQGYHTARPVMYSKGLRQATGCTQIPELFCST
jgi:EAL and modified HD-GYP domain-containing signal transduction protein